MDKIIVFIIFQKHVWVSFRIQISLRFYPIFFINFVSNFLNYLNIILKNKLSSIVILNII
jgi:hypothetical protein